MGCADKTLGYHDLPHLLAQVGVIGECNRDGNRHSRVLRIDPEGYEIFTMDHDSGELRRDLKHSWRDTEAPKPLLPPEDELLCDPNAGAGGFSRSLVSMPAIDPFLSFQAGFAARLALKDFKLVRWIMDGS